jgi:diadenosine tetraphosphatase ApaH/serine/threonine PP2A family protein phosphatase
MLVLVISDIHANLEALEAVLRDAATADADGRVFDSVWCLGDLVGYGPDPNECVARVRSQPGLTCLIGNHDQACLGWIPISRFNHDARRAVEWTGQNLSPENRAFLESLPSQSAVGDFTLAHGSPRQPVWEYILDPRTAQRNFEVFPTNYCLVGHSHFPLVFLKDGPDSYARPIPVPWNEPMPLRPRMILNPGSVGQPRDLDPRSAYALLDVDRMTWQPRRVAYNVGPVQQRMLAAGLPEKQALRLFAGW